MSNLQRKIENKSAKVAVIGLGYVGLPLCLEFVKAGFNVLGIDISKRKIELLKSGRSDILDVSDIDIQNAFDNQRLKVVNNYKVLNNTDCICITVPTPLNKSKEPDLSYINASVKELKKYIQKDILIVLESTTYPGATRELLAHELELLEYEIGRDIFVAFSPERVDPGNRHFALSTIPKVIGGITEKCGQMAKQLYQNITNEIHLVNSTEEAEMVKLLENTFRAVNIGLVNEMAIMCDRMGIDIWNVIEAATTKPFGFMKFSPGPGLGGHCIPLDPIFLSYKARRYNYYNRFIELATDINGNMPRFIISKLIKILNTQGRSLKKSKILILGIAYKENVNDIRESPGIEIFKLLEEFECKADYYDPFVNCFTNQNGEKIKAIDINDKDRLKSYQCTIIVTAHGKVNYDYILENSSSIFDTRNIYTKVVNEKIHKL